MEAMKSEVSPARAARFAGVRPTDLEALTLVERLHRRLLDVIKHELTGAAAAMSTPFKPCCCIISPTRS